MNEISIVSLDFRTRLLKDLKNIQWNLTWMESNSKFPVHLPQKTTEGLRIELAILEFCNKSSLRLNTGIKKTLERCTYFYKKMCIVHNKFQTSFVAKIKEFPNKYQHMKDLEDRL